MVVLEMRNNPENTQQYDNMDWICKYTTTWKLSQFGVNSGSYLLAFWMTTEKYPKIMDLRILEYGHFPHK